MQQSPQSPCNLICTLNDQNICIGCYRTIEEIALWLEATDTQKTEILKRVAERVQAAEE